MKTIVLVLAVIFVTTPTVQAIDDAGHTVKVLSDRMDVLYLKVSEAYLGASVTVLDKDGQVVFETSASSRKFVVDFFERASGDYVVHIQKGGFSQDVAYHKI